MSLFVAHLDENRMRRIRKDCIRDIVPIDGMPNCYNLVRDNTKAGEGDFWDDEPLTYKQGFSLDTIYKYLDFDGFIKTLKTGFLFKEPSQWPDPYEKRFYDAHYHNIDKQHTPKPLYSCCFTKGKESEASWLQYAGNKGFSSRVVRISLNYKKLINAFSQYATRNQCRVYSGAVTYKYTQQEIDDINSGYKSRSFWLSNFSLKNYLSLLLVKRDAFYNEQEVRLFIIPQKEQDLGKEGKLFVESGMNWGELITEVLLCPDATDEELAFFKWLCKEKGVDCCVEKSMLKKECPEIEIIPIEKNESFIARIYDDLVGE